MKHIYGLDIGTTSVGWAVIEYDATQSLGRILAMGVRIFPEARGPDGVPLNQNRRQKRLVRRQLRRRRQRRRDLNTLFTQHCLLPPFSKDKESEWAKVMEQQPLALRRKGLTEALEPHELGRALYHLARLRHYKGREVDESDKPQDGESADEKAARSGREQTIQALKNSRETLGQWLEQRAPKLGLKKGVARQNRIRGDVPKEQTRRIHALRSHVEDEFDRLVKAQQAHHPILCDREFLGALREIVFAQRPVFWRKNTLGQCSFIPGAPLCPKGSWLSQQRRMLEKLNNLAVVGGNMRPLDPEERAAILDKLQSQATMTWAGVRAALKPLYKKRGEPGEERALRFNLELGGESKLLGNAVEAKILEVFGDSWADHPHRQAIRDAIHERLWKADYGEIGEQRVVILSEVERRKRRTAVAESFARDFGIATKQATLLADLKLPTGWEPYSIDALRVFLPRLEDGIRFGVLKAGMEWADWRATNFPGREQPTGETFDRLLSPADRDEQKRQSAIRNPTVVRAQNELRKVVNNLIEAYGKPNLIRIELAREIGLSKREREEMQSGLRKQEKRRRDAADDLKGRGIPLPSRADIEKWMLWKESQERCPYTGDQICFDALFGNVRFDVEHIWPRFRSLDDSFRNKTLCRRDVNIAKGNRTPFEFYQGNPDAWSAVTNRLQKLVAGKGSPGMPLSKVKRFLAESIPEDFASRQLNDTGYAARQAVAFLKRLWPDLGLEAPVTVQAVTGRVTAQLRRLWGLNNILSDDGEKTRADHRHHAVDALVVACTEPGIINRLSRYWQQKDNRSSEQPHLPPPWSDIRDEVERMRDKGEIRISHRVRKKVSGPLHAEMPFGDTEDKEVKNETVFSVFVKKMPVERLSLATLRIDHVSQISKTAKFVVRDPRVRRTLAEHLERAGGDPKKAYPPYPRLSPDGPEVRKARVLSLQQKNLMAPISIQENSAGVRQPNGFADLANNHHVAIYRLGDGSVAFETVSLYEAARRLARREPIVRHACPHGGAFVISLAPGEAVEFTRGERSGIWIVRGTWSNGQVVLTRDTDARPTGKTEAQRLGMDGPREEFRPKVSAFLSDGVRKVSVDPIGRVRPAND